MSALHEHLGDGRTSGPSRPRLQLVTDATGEAEEPAGDGLRVLLVSSAGGHLAHLMMLEPWWREHERHWVTFEKADAVAALASEPTSWAHHPTTRNLSNAVRNLGLARRVIGEFRPDVVVTSGAGVGFPFVLLASAMGIRCVYVEVFDRVERPTLTGALCYPLCELFATQWDSQHAAYPEGRKVGWLW